MAIEALISWNAPTHVYTEKNHDWYWSVGIITLAIAAVCFIFSQILTGIFVILAAVALVLHASKHPRTVYHEINDRGIVVDNILYPFLALDSFWIPHDQHGPAKLLIRSHKTFMPLIVILIDEVDPEQVREIMLKYIAETEHHQQFLHHVLEGLGF
ncbi:MAG: hypothetical protein WCO48_00720 [Candidatus Taylorbacteria bacterium]